MSTATIINIHDEATLPDGVVSVLTERGGRALRSLYRSEPRLLGWTVRFPGSLKPEQRELLRQSGFRHVGRDWDRVDVDGEHE